MNKKERDIILVVCHDAGGAEVVSAYVKKNLKRTNFVCLAVGPAERIFKRKGLGHYLIIDEKKAKNLLISAKKLITGTSWGSLIELDFIREAKRAGVKSVSYLDHWVNYRERFGYPKKDWKRHLPDEIWVGDLYAQKIAQKFFGKKKVKFVPNLYWVEIKEYYSCLKKPYGKVGSAILFMSDHMANDREVFQDFLANLASKKIEDLIIIRFHPADDPRKFDDILQRYKKILFIKKSSQKNIANDIVDARVVVGLGSSMALVVALLCGKRVISIVSNNSSQYTLPFPKIRKIRNASEILF